MSNDAVQGGKKEDKGAPAWVVTFGDLMSLLLCFFVLIVSMSSVDPQEFSKASGALRGSLGILSEDMFRASDYNFRLLSPALGLRPLTVEVHKGPLAAIPWGIEQTRDLILEAYATLFGLARGDVSPKVVSGPVGITQVAIYAGRESTVQLIYLMATISCFLAVMNFLPLPVFDGGLAALLVVEKIRGKPLPAKVTNAMQIVGLVLIGCLFIAVTFNDIMRILGF